MSDLKLFRLPGEQTHSSIAGFSIPSSLPAIQKTSLLLLPLHLLLWRATTLRALLPPLIFWESTIIRAKWCVRPEMRIKPIFPEGSRKLLKYQEPAIHKWERAGKCTHQG